MTMQGTQTRARVQTPSGQNLGLDQIRAVRLNDGWHAIDECQVSYKANGQTKQVPFSEIQGFSDLDESSQGGNS